VFERFSERGRQVVVLAQDEARALKHNYVGTEHILLGLLREEGLAARVLESLDITVQRVRAQVVRIVGSGDEVTAGQIPFTPRAKKVLELSLREAFSLHHGHVGAEHILLGLVRENEGVATQVLLDCDADSEKIRDKLMQMMPVRAAGTVGAATVAAAASPARALPDVDELIRLGFADDARRVIMAAGARALDDSRLRIESYDLLLALCRDAAIAPVLAALGVDEAAVRDAIERRRRPEGPSEGSGEGPGEGSGEGPGEGPG
jgi:hypothetical protein